MDKISLKFILGGFLLFLILFLIITDKKKIEIIKESLKPLHIRIYLVLTIIFYLLINYGINNKQFNFITIDQKEHKRIKNITHQSLFGLIIALFAHLHLFISPFWFIFFLMYFNILDPIS